MAADIAGSPRAIARIEGPGRLRIGFILAKQFTLSAFSLFVDTLRLGGKEHLAGRALFDWHVISGSSHMIVSSCGIQLSRTAGPGSPERYDYIVIIGGELNIEEQSDRATRAFLREAARRRVPLIGLGTGSFLLAEEGLLGNRLACVSWLHHEAFKRRFPQLRVTAHQLFVEDRRITTCVGGSAAANVAAFIIRRHIGLEAEKNALEVLHIERRTNTVQQNGTPIQLPTRHDRRIRASLLYMEQYLCERIDLDGLAQKVGVSRRQLERIFAEKAGTSPREALTRIRINKACTLLERTTQRIIDVALEVGFENSSHFTRKFREAMGVTPSCFRRQKQCASEEAAADAFEWNTLTASDKCALQPASIGRAKLAASNTASTGCAGNGTFSADRFPPVSK